MNPLSPSKLTEYLSSLAKDRDLRWHFSWYGSLLVFGSNTAIELDCGTTNIQLYFFYDYNSREISHCDEFDVSEPDSIDKIMKWVDKL